MNITRLEQFLLLAELQNMSKAAEMLFISQSALSQSIDALEKELNCKLFDREKKRLTLNRYGQFLLPYAKAIVEKNDEMRLALDKFHSAHNTLNIGGSIYALYIMLTAAYNLHDSTVQTYFTRCVPEEAFQLLKSHEIDVAITIGPLRDEAVKSTLLLEDRPYVLVPDGSPLCGRKEISIQDLRGMRLYRNSDILRDSSIFYVQGNNDRVMMEQLRVNGIHSDFVDFHTMRLLWDSKDHCFITNEIPFFVSRELQNLPRERFVYFKDGTVTPHYLSVLNNPSENVARFMDWFTDEKNPLTADIARVRQWLDQKPSQEQ